MNKQTGLRGQIAAGLALVALFTAQLAAAETSVEVNAGGKTEFLAVGRPSAIKINGQGGGPQGKLTVIKQAASGEITMDMTTFKTGIGLRDTHMKEKYIQVDKFPKATLVLNNLPLPDAVAKTASGKAAGLPFKAKLNLRGVEHEVSGSWNVSRSNDKLTVFAQFPIKLTDYNFEIPSYMGIKVAEDVVVNVEFDMQVKDKEVLALAN
jgi:polyisoprenoid-binding protein YceI